MKRFFPQIRRSCAWIRIHHLEVELQAQTDALEACDDPDLRDVIEATRRITRRELVISRQRYHDLLPPGVRHTWRTA